MAKTKKASGKARSAPKSSSRTKPAKTVAKKSVKKPTAKKPPVKAKTKPAKPSKSQKTKAPIKTQTTKATASKLEPTSEMLILEFKSSLMAIIHHWQAKAGVLQQNFVKQKSPTTAQQNELLHCQSEILKYAELNALIKQFEQEWGKPKQYKSAAQTPDYDDDEPRRAPSKSWDDEGLDFESDFADDETNENLDEIFLPLDEEELTFDGDEDFSAESDEE